MREGEITLMEFLKNKLLKQKTVDNELIRTIVTSHMEIDMDSSKNILYCSTFQLAWNELKDSIIKENIVLNTSLPMVDSLNKSLSTKHDVSEDSYVAMAGYGLDNILVRVNETLKKKFQEFAPTLEEDLAPDDILAYGFLYKNLQFKDEFECINEPIKFKAENKIYNVNGFGINNYSPSEIHDSLSKQVIVYDYNNDSDFIIGLNPVSDYDEIILAMLNPKQTLLETIAAVEDRIRNGKQCKLGSGDTLQIPCINFESKHSYTDLIGKKLLNKGFQGYIIVKASQDTLFKLNEKGALLKSEAVMKLSRCMAVRSVMHLEFNKPFLIMLKDRKAKLPYLAIWINNTELLQN